MADRKTGPLKAPIIEGQARPSELGDDLAVTPPAEAVLPPDPVSETSFGSEPLPSGAPIEETILSPAPPEATADASPHEPPHRHTSRQSGSEHTSSAAANATASTLHAAPPERRSSPWSNWVAPALAGAVLGTLLTYLLGTVYPLPGPAVPDASADIAALNKRLDALEGNLTGVSSSAAKTQQSLDQTVPQLNKGLSDLTKKVADLGSAKPPSIDLGPVQADLKALGSRVDAIASGASGADAEAMSSRLAAVENTVSTVSGKLDGVDGEVASLRTNLDQTKTSLTQQIAADPTGPAVKLSVLLSSLETAFSSGQPFTAELANLRTLQPPPDIPDVLKNAAPSGLTRPDLVMQRFETVLPQMLAARQTNTTDWGAGAVDWVKGLLAIRPMAETEGNSPDAVTSRLEAAMTRQDYDEAAKLLAALPEPMRQAAGPIAEDITVHAAADRLLTDLRGQALIAAEKTP